MARDTENKFIGVKLALVAIVIAAAYAVLVLLVDRLLGKEAASLVGVTLTALAVGIIRQVETTSPSSRPQSLGSVSLQSLTFKVSGRLRWLLVALSFLGGHQIGANVGFVTSSVLGLPRELYFALLPLAYLLVGYVSARVTMDRRLWFIMMAAAAASVTSLLISLSNIAVHYTLDGHALKFSVIEVVATFVNTAAAGIGAFFGLRRGGMGIAAPYELK